MVGNFQVPVQYSNTLFIAFGCWRSSTCSPNCCLHRSEHSSTDERFASSKALPGRDIPDFLAHNPLFNVRMGLKEQVSVRRLRGIAVLLLLLVLAASDFITSLIAVQQRRLEQGARRGAEEPKKEASEDNKTTVSSSLLPLEPKLTRKKEASKHKTAVSLPLFPREPKLTPGCSVKFQHTNMSLCYFLPYGANFGDELGPAVVKRILEYHFGCSSTDVHVIDMSGPPGKRNNRTCLFALGSIFHYTRDGDHIWGTGMNPYWQRKHPKWLHVHSVRGNETERKMKEWYNYDSVPHGDPGNAPSSLLSTLSYANRHFCAQGF